MRQLHPISGCDNSARKADILFIHGEAAMVGDVLRVQGDLAGALDSYRKSLKVIRHLAKMDVTNAVWQRDLSASLYRLAQTYDQQGDRVAAILYAEESLAISERLSALDRANVGWQNDVAASRALVARLRG